MSLSPQMDIIVDRISSCSTTIRGGVKKEEEEEIVVKEEKEEEAEVENEGEGEGEEDDHVKKNYSKDSRPNCSKIINGNNNQHPLDYNDDYADWTKGNWCWLLPTANNGITTTHHSAAAVKSEESSSSDNTTTIPPVIGKRAPKRRRESRGKQQQRDTSVVPAKELLSENDDDEELPKKKKNKLKSCRLQQQYNSSTIYPKNSSPSSNDAIQDNETKVDDNKNEKGKVDRTIIKREEGINIKEEEDSDSVPSAAAVNNNNNNDNDNDNIVHENDFGYESWTEGNWCLLLPSTTTTTTTTATTSAADVDKKNGNEPPSEKVSVIENNTTQRRLRSSSCRRSDITSSVFLGGGDDDTDENEYDDEDYADNNDDIIDRKTKTTEKRAVKYKDNAYSKIWHGMFQRLVAYKNQHGSTNVPRSYKEDLKLAIWVSSQRRYYNNNEISLERIRRLDYIGFVWKMVERLPWDEMFQKLVAYKKQHKSTNVPRSYKEDPKLGMWVHNQRTNYNYKSLSIERINHLESIGFVWNVLDAQWMEMYNRLVTYKKKYNSTIVPRKYKTDQKLATWVQFQRHTYNKDNLLEKRLKLLNSINFVWSAKKASS